MRDHQKSLLALIVRSPALIVPSTSLIAPLPVIRFPNKLVSDVPHNMLKNAPFCSFASFSILLKFLLKNKIFEEI